MGDKSQILFRNQLALASIFFFRPLTKGMINKSSFNLNDIEKDFIEGYIKVGIISSFFFFLYIIATISKYYFRNGILDPISKILIIIVLVTIVFGIIGIFSNININQNIETSNEIEKKNIFIKYLPLANIYLRYNNHNFENPDIVLKESIILRIIFFIFLFTNTILLTISAGIIIVLRIVSILIGVDLFGKSLKNIANKIFYTNPEEMRAYVSGSIKHLLSKDNENFQETINTQKDNYKKLYHTQDISHIKIQYTIFIIAVCVLVYFNISNISILITLFFLIGRYVIMQIKWKHLPSLPLIREITFGIIMIYHKFNKIKNNKGEQKN